MLFIKRVWKFEFVFCGRGASMEIETERPSLFVGSARRFVQVIVH